MSDIAVKEITVPSLPSSRPLTESEKLPINIETAPKKGEWVRTRLCYCPFSASTDCRFHSQKEPGWETCPWEKKSGKISGRWLWARQSHETISEDQLSVGAEIKELTKDQQHAADRYLH